MIETVSEVGIEGTYLHTIKAIYDKLTANIILNEHNLQNFPSDREQDRDVHFHHSYPTW